MKYSLLLLFCGLSLLLLFVAANPPNPCADPANYNLVVPLRRATATNANLVFSSDSSLDLVNGCYTLRLNQYGLAANQHTYTDTAPYASVQFIAYLINTCTGYTVYLSAGQTLEYQTLLTLSSNLDRASLAGLFISGTAYTNEGTIGFSVTTTPVNFEGHSPVQSKFSGRSVSRYGSQCISVFQATFLNSDPVSTNLFTISVTMDGYDQIDFVVPSNVSAIAGTTNGVNTYHQCNCSGL